VSRKTHWIDGRVRGGCAGTPEGDGMRSGTSATPRKRLRFHPLRPASPRRTQYQSGLHCLSYHNGGTKPQPEGKRVGPTGGRRRSNSTPKPRRSLLPFRSTPPPLPPLTLPDHSLVHQRADYYPSPRLRSPSALSLFYVRSANNKTTLERRGIAAWRAFRPSFPPRSIILSPLSLSLCAASSAIVGSCRFPKYEYQPQNKRQRLAAQDESIVPL